jgi:hypothetical protein
LDLNDEASVEVIDSSAGRESGIDVMKVLKLVLGIHDDISDLSLGAVVRGHST